MKYLIAFWEDEFSLVDEIEVEVNSIAEINKIIDKYYDENLKGKFDIAGTKWRRISDE